MNGHEDAETLAFSLAEIRQRVEQPKRSEEDSPLFIFAPGWGSGERDLRRRLARSWGDEAILDPALIAAMGWQLVRSASVLETSREKAAHDAQAEKKAKQDTQHLGESKTGAGKAMHLREKRG